MSKLELTPQVFAILSALVEERVGLRYDAGDRDVFADKIRDIMLEAGFDSFLDYYYFLRYDDRGVEAFERLVESLVVGETYFFRELEPLRRLVDDVLAPLAAAGRRPRVWCAACASGEEPLTLAMLLAERRLLPAVELLASDISERALAIARRGLYGRRSLRDLRPPELEKYIELRGDGFSVREELRAAIRWERVNLLDDRAIATLGTFDAILCRNVLIYFGDATSQHVVESFTRALRPHGVLLVGVSESLLRFGTSLDCEERGGVFMYRKEG
jgi:chemotaxis protein methyltransferase CheR